MGLHCPTCRCTSIDPIPTKLLRKWVNDGVKAEGLHYFCVPKCRSCMGGRCPREPFCQRYIEGGKP